jgi:uncharacterized protein with HEPN domain
MFKRGLRLYVEDIIDSIKAIEAFTKGLDYRDFADDRKTYSATLREFTVIGEAISNIPDEIKESFPDIEWRLIKDFRNFLVHEYFGIDSEIVWDAVTKELPLLKSKFSRLKSILPEED